MNHFKINCSEIKSFIEKKSFGNISDNSKVVHSESNGNDRCNNNTDKRRRNLCIPLFGPNYHNGNYDKTDYYCIKLRNKSELSVRKKLFNRRKAFAVSTEEIIYLTKRNDNGNT